MEFVVYVGVYDCTYHPGSVIQPHVKHQNLHWPCKEIVYRMVLMAPGHLHEFVVALIVYLIINGLMVSQTHTSHFHHLSTFSNQWVAPCQPPGSQVRAGSLSS